MRRGRRSLQKGEGAFGCIVWTLLLVIAVMIAWKMVPIKVASAKLYDYMDDQARFAANNSAERIRKGIIQKARELGLPVDPKQVEVQKPGDNIKMRVEYTVDVEFPGYTYEWEFLHVVDRPIFIF